MAYDIIGDIHGQAGKLEALLKKLGYRINQGTYRHPQGRTAVFLGDLIDRGPEQWQVVQLVRAMIDGGSARCIMGNHEWNAIGFTIRAPAGGRQDFLRPHSARNLAQHHAFLQQIGTDPARHRQCIDFFRILPPALDLGGIRAVHAWWSQAHVDLVGRCLAPQAPMSDDFVIDGCRKGSPLKIAIDGLTKGLELPIPDDGYFIGAEGHQHHEIRSAWWRHEARTYRDAAIMPRAQAHLVPDLDLPAGQPLAPISGAPIFVGHYWFTGEPRIETPRLAVLDYSAAKNGPLVAYRWDGESDLSNAHFLAVT